MEDNYKYKNRRKSDRLDTTLTLVYQIEKPLALRIQFGFTDNIDALLFNLSDSGMAIITKHDLPIGIRLHFKFTIIDLRLKGDERCRHMEFTGETVSNISLPDSSHRIGIRFYGILAADKLIISNFVKRNKLLA
jgi:c-di-GMP-binding flagellar brake protein YcgR